MPITAQKLLTELGSNAWSGFNADDMVFTSEDALQAKTELNKALRYLINLRDFPFRKKEKTITTDVGSETYSMVAGQIVDIYNADDFTKLDFISDTTDYDKTKTGTPVGYWIEYSKPEKTKIRLYPIPDGVYNYNVVYSQYQPIMSADNKTLKCEFESASDYINMPEPIAYLFMDCVVMRTIITNMKDDQDENYQPAINEFNEYWRNFLRACKPHRQNCKVVW